MLRLVLGSPVRCTDGDAGELVDVVVDLQQQRVTHLIVGPGNRPDLARLIPVARARAEQAGDGVELSASVAEFGACETVHHTAYLRFGEHPVAGPGRDIGIDELYATPDVMGAGGLDVAPIDVDPHAFVGYDEVPEGEVELRRKSRITSSDGKHVGNLDGFVVGEDARITSLLVHHGHLWRRREVAVPAAAISKMQSDAVDLTLSARDVGKLPKVPAPA